MSHSYDADSDDDGSRDVSFQSEAAVSEALDVEQGSESDRLLSSSGGAEASTPEGIHNGTTGPSIETGMRSTDDFQQETVASYHAAIRQRITEVFAALYGVDLPHGCALDLTLGAEGSVLEATTSGGCKAPPEIEDQLAAAALMAQPLPYQGYEAVFKPAMTLRLDEESDDDY
ncbi:hypothetical protein ABE488_12935 [Luteimonas sp. TWI662]|uniref:hypothetical protein n=1 Tax=Luteimonas sp. TWI662 TaxID=3136789 RepID=UPI00320AE962